MYTFYCCGNISRIQTFMIKGNCIYATFICLYIWLCFHEFILRCRLKCLIKNIDYVAQSSFDLCYLHFNNFKIQKFENLQISKNRFEIPINDCKKAPFIDNYYLSEDDCKEQSNFSISPIGWGFLVNIQIIC